jgi:hypothetical protein
MKWADAMIGSDSRQSADRFVSGALRRIRIRSKLKKLMWMEGMLATPRRSVARELEERFPSQD